MEITSRHLTRSNRFSTSGGNLYDDQMQDTTPMPDKHPDLGQPIGFGQPPGGGVDDALEYVSRGGEAEEVSRAISIVKMRKGQSLEVRCVARKVSDGLE